MMNQGDRVRIVKVSDRARAKIGLANPRVGDIGIIRCALKDSWQQQSGYLVDCARPDGSSVWMADFTADEVEGTEQHGKADDFAALALAHAKGLVAVAKMNGHVRGITDAKFCWLSGDSADAHADLLRAAGLAFFQCERGGQPLVEHFQPVADAGFWAKLDPVRAANGIGKLHFRKDEP